MRCLQLLLPLLFITVAPTNGSLLLAANSQDFRRIAEKILPKGMATKITEYLKLLSLTRTQNDEVQEFLSENLRVDNEDVYRQDPATFVNENSKRHYSVNIKDLMSQVKGLISLFFNKNNNETKVQSKNVDSAKAFDRESNERVRVQKFDWKKGLDEPGPEKYKVESKESNEKTAHMSKNLEHNNNVKQRIATTKRYFKYFTTKTLKASKVDTKPIYNNDRVKSKEVKVSFERVPYVKDDETFKLSYEKDKRFTRIFKEESYETRYSGDEDQKSKENDQSFKKVSSERIHENRERMKTNMQAKFPKQQEKHASKFDQDTKVLEILKYDKKSTEDNEMKRHEEGHKKTRFQIEDGSKNDGRKLTEHELDSKPKYHEEYIGVGKSIKDWDVQPVNKIIGTKIPTRKHFTMSTPDLYNKQENVAVPQNKDEPIPESDQEPEKFPKERPYLTGIINGKKQIHKTPMKRSQLEPQKSEVRRQFK